MTTTKSSNLFEIPVTDIDGKTTTLEPYIGKVMLIVNVASRCGFTSQYKELEQLYRDYEKRGLVVLGFPCDQFLHQEPGQNKQIKEFAESCYRVTFPMFAKINVIGDKRTPIYSYLAKNIEKKPLIFIPWNFTKILVDANGKILKRYLPTKLFKSIREEIEALLPATGAS